MKTKKTVIKPDKLKSNKELLAKLREADASGDLSVGYSNLVLDAADRIEALVAALVEIEIKLKTHKCT